MSIKSLRPNRTCHPQRSWAVSGRMTVILLFVAFMLTGCALPSYEARLVAADLAAGSGPSELKSITAAPVRKTITFARSHRYFVADLYRPGAKPRAAVLLVPGAAEEGKDDPRLVDFARTLSRAQFLVLVPDLPGLRRLQVTPDNIQEVADAFHYLTSGDDFAAPPRAGIVAFSYGVGPAVIAAMEPTLADDVKFLVGIGGYYDLDSVLTFATTGYYWLDGQWRYTKPNDYGKWIFVLSNADRLSDAADRQGLRTLADWHLGGEPGMEPAVRLGPEGSAVYRFVTNRDPDKAAALISRLPRSVQSTISALDLSNKDLSHLKAHVILVHGRHDNIIPYTQSIHLADALPPQQVELFLLSGLFHVDIGPFAFLDQLRFARAVDAVLAQRAPAPTLQLSHEGRPPHGP